MTTNDSLEQQLAPLAQRLATLQEARDRITEQEDQVKARIRDLLEVHGPGTYAAGGVNVQLQPNTRLDLKAIATKYPHSEHPELYCPPAVDTKKVRAHFAPVDLELLTNHGVPKVVLK